ncbi:MAG: hypothetical protein IPL65_17250 [Lewinellaceae bacterium]|nr:hypothetical protein [Lewinellaceae bacterium]
MDATLLSKYDVAAPRYTSYPTVPYWSGDHNVANGWPLQVKDAFKADPQISLYLHLPFCESLCTYCGCNKHITKNHAVESPYIEALLQEWHMYLRILEKAPVLKEICAR